MKNKQISIIMDLDTNKIGAIPNIYIKGELRLPKYNFEHGAPLSQKLIDQIRESRKYKSNIAALDCLKYGDNTISGHLRGIDGPGSSLDLPEFQIELTSKGKFIKQKVLEALNNDMKIYKQIANEIFKDPDKNILELKTDLNLEEVKNSIQNISPKLSDYIDSNNEITNIASTPTIASKFDVKIKFEKSTDPNIIEYIAPDYKINRPYVIRKSIKLNEFGKTPKGQLDAPAYILSNIFGLKGIKITLESIAPVAQAGGMESSNVFNTALLMAGNIISGANLSEADIFSLAVKLENDEFGGLTGGQGHLCCLLGGAYQHIWTSGLKDAKGKSLGYGAFSIPLLDENNLSKISDHSLLVQAGKNYVNGTAVVPRIAALVNEIWTALLRDKDRVGYELHSLKPGLTAQFTSALKEQDFGTAAKITGQYVQIRNDLVKRWVMLLLAYCQKEQGDSISFNSLDEREKELAEKYYKTVFIKENNPEYNSFQLVRDLYEKHENNLKNQALYILGADNLIPKALEKEIAIMPLGAGGPGANMIAISKYGKEYIKDFLKSFDPDMKEITEKSARKIMNGTGKLIGYLNFETGINPIEIKGFAGRPAPKKGNFCYYNQKEGVFHNC